MLSCSPPSCTLVSITCEACCEVSSTRSAQGFGNVGAWAAEIFQEQGGVVQAVSDAYGALYNEQGIDIKALRQHLGEGNSLDSFTGGAPYFTASAL